MEKWVPFTLVALGASLLLQDQGVQANPVRHYGTRMEALFVRMDANRDGRLESREVTGQPYLERRLQRHPTRKYLLIEAKLPNARVVGVLACCGEQRGINGVVHGSVVDGKFGRQTSYIAWPIGSISNCLLLACVAPLGFAFGRKPGLGL